MIEFSEWAVEVLARASDAATRLNPDAKIRLAMEGGSLGSSLTDAPAEGDTTTEIGGRTVYVADGVSGLVDVEPPHDRIVLRPAGSEPAPRPDL